MTDASSATHIPFVSRHTRETTVDAAAALHGDQGPSVAACQRSEETRLEAFQAECDAGTRELNSDDVRWLLVEAGRVSRINRAFEARVAELERELKAKACDYTGVCLEYADLADENTRLKQEHEIDSIVLDARGRTILELQKQLAGPSEANCQGE